MSWLRLGALNSEVVDAVTISQGDIFSDVEGALDNDAPISIEADAIVSPANSFGFMDGGIDAVYSHVLAPGCNAACKPTSKPTSGASYSLDRPRSSRPTTRPFRGASVRRRCGRPASLTTR